MFSFGMNAYIELGRNVILSERDHFCSNHIINEQFSWSTLPWGKSRLTRLGKTINI